MLFQNLEVKTYKVKLEPENSPWALAPYARQLPPTVIFPWTTSGGQFPPRTVSPQTITPWAIPI